MSRLHFHPIQGRTLDIIDDILHTEEVASMDNALSLPFNPLEQEAPDTSLPMSQRPIGGLGIYLILKKVDTIAYEYTDSENVLTVSLQVNPLRCFH
jgi:anti-sigma regulatory factor (Ser/Thr protein kinase)